jgi:hypothetical protein
MVSGMPLDPVNAGRLVKNFNPVIHKLDKNLRPHTIKELPERERLEWFIDHAPPGIYSIGKSVLKVEKVAKNN